MSLEIKTVEQRKLSIYSCKIRLRVIFAVFMRDIQTRVGRSYFGFLISLLIPLSHIAILLSVYIVLGRKAALGTDSTLYLTSAILPFIIWSYTHQRIIQAHYQNNSLLSLPIVTLNDLILARFFVEILNSTLITSIVAVFLYFFSFDLYISNMERVIFLIILSYLLGLSTGCLLGVLGHYYPGSLIFSYIIIPIYWITCGIFFIPDALPDAVRDIVYFFPLSHIVDLMRTAIYPTYVSNYSYIEYVIAVIVCNIFLSALVKKFMRSIKSV